MSTHHENVWGHFEEDCTPDCQGWPFRHNPPLKEWGDEDVKQTSAGYDISDAAAREILDASNRSQDERRRDLTDKRDLAIWADEAMYHAAPDEMVAAGERPAPQVTLVSMTPRPLQTMAAAAELYAGRVVHNPADVPQQAALNWWRDMTKTALQAPLEFIDFHFLFEGVTRAFTHQLVRQRTAVFVQESMRFAVKDNARDNVALPPSIAEMPDDHPMRVIWMRAEASMGWAYNAMIDGGVPAEDARALLPTNITTKIHYKTNLRNLAEHAGMRLCSQAQFEWKEVWAGILEAINAYGPIEQRWQQLAISNLFRPICYRTGRCEFRAETDRWCVIRGRVEDHFAKGERPAMWIDIDPREPLLEGAARKPPTV